MTERDIRAFLPLHPMEFRVLLQLCDGRPNFPAQLVQGAERRKGSRRSPYPKELMNTIRKLVEAALLQRSGGPPEGARKKDWFIISELGKKVLVAEAKRLESMVLEAKEMNIL